MKNKGFRLAITGLFLLVSAWYLYPTFRSFSFTRTMMSMEPEERVTFRQANADAIMSAEERAIKLGLDLQGGMHVTMELRVDELLRALASDTDADFDTALQQAVEQSQTTDASMVDLFVQAFEETSPNGRLSRYYRSESQNITRRSTNGEIQAYLNLQANDAVDRAVQIVRQRIDRFGVSEPNIQRQGTRRIVVELPGVDDAERVRRLLRGTARLEFRLMADPEALQRSVSNIIAYYEGAGQAATDTTAQADSAAVASVSADTTLDVASLTQPTQEAISNPLLRIFTPFAGGSLIVGTVAVADTAQLHDLLRAPQVAGMIPSGVEFLYEARPAPDGRLTLLAVRSQVELTGETIEEATVQFDEVNRAQVSMTMNAEGARIWAGLTGRNIGRNVAIVLDDLVYSYPTVQGRIPGGRSQITGLGDRSEAQDIVNILRSGSLPAPVTIIEERTVGPSLGAASIRAGSLSFIAGLLIVALFMVFYYHFAGVTANVALVMNIVFLLGILAAFGATLTLPGIAGIVLTIGMAVDANVLVFERIREELKAGRNIRSAVEQGFAKAFSAIFDANITTFFTGLILYSFGVGPIQGFAVTLMAGIVASLFSVLVVSRLVIEYFVFEKGKEISVG